MKTKFEFLETVSVVAEYNEMKENLSKRGETIGQVMENMTKEETKEFIGLLSKLKKELQKLYIETENVELVDKINQTKKLLKGFNYHYKYNY